MPLNVKRFTERYKQMCGCEQCIIPRSLQESLNPRRRRHYNNLKDDEQ